jgi:prophage regulatory protein
MESQTMKLLDLDALADKGIKFSDTHIWRLIRAGRFPKPVQIGKRNHWVETEIDKYITDSWPRAMAPAFRQLADNQQTPQGSE